MGDRRRFQLHTFFWIAGFLAVFAMGIPYLILGQDAIVTYHDQLDGELIAYLLQAKHLFQGSTLPEFLGGVSKTALTPPAPAAVLLFLSGNAFGALAFLQVSESLCGYVGMALLARRVTGRPLIAAAVGVLYAYLPFLPVYGLAQYGLPLLLYLLLEAKEGRHTRLCLAYAAFFALNSSLVLVGFGVLGALLLWMLWELWRGRRGRGTPFFRRRLLWCFLVMLGIYVLENLRLFAELLGLGAAGAVVSHKSEYAMYPEAFAPALWQGFLQGGQHSGDFHVLFLLPVLLAAVCGWALGTRAGRGASSGRCEEALKRDLRAMAVALGCNLFLAAAAALWNTEGCIRLRERFQAFGAFQMDRLLWLAPCLWYLILACGLALVWELWESGGRLRAPAALLGLVMAAALCGTGGKVLLESNFKWNVQRLRNPDYGAISFNDYYAVGVYSQVEEFLRERTGEEKEDYRVVSLGIDPAAALYHGFYTLDGYSNNYPLKYKHAFRRILSPELERSDYLADNFDKWGNRCYLFSSECPGYYTIEKGGFAFLDYRLDAEALWEMGGRYLFSAAYILNAEQQGLVLMREEPFSTEESYYQIYVYRVEPD